MSRVNPQSTVQQPLSGHRVAFTGKLASMKRDDAFRMVRDAGGEPVDSINHSTTLLVVGMEGWPMLSDGRISSKLARAERLRGAGYPIDVLSEHAFFEWLNNGEHGSPHDAAVRTCSLKHASRALDVSESTLRRWEHFGLLRSSGGMLDFRDLVSLRTIAKLVRDGMTPANIAMGLSRLAQVLPEAVQPLAQARILAESGTLIAELQGMRVDAHGQLLFEFDDRGRADSAVSLAQKKAERADPGTWFDYGLECQEQGMWPQAEAAYGRALELIPDWPEAHFNMGSLLQAQGRLEEAEAHYREAITYDPELACAWYNLAHVLDDQDRVAEAVSALRNALKVLPTYADAHFNLALCYRRMDDKANEADHWRAYLKLDPSSEWADIARQCLSECIGRQTH